MVKRAKRRLAVLLSVSILSLLLGGCGNGNDSLHNHAGNTGDAPAKNSGSIKGAASSTDGTAMGRYVEKTIDLSGSIGYATGIYGLEDGSLVIGTDSSFLVTEDNGESWKTDARSWMAQLQKDCDIRSLAIGKDNTVGVIYDTVVQDSSAQDYNPFEENLEVMIVKPDGTQIPVEMTMEGADERPYRIWISDTCRIFVSTLGANPNIYEVAQDGSSEKFLELEADATLIQFQGNLMMIDGFNYDGLLLYDMEKEQYIEDEVLDDFIEENYKNRTNNGGSYYDLYFFMGEENVLYLAGEKGLHRHVIGGSAIEQVIDGSLSIFNNPSYNVRGMVMTHDNEFMALFSNDKLVRFTYNPDIPTVPSEKLKVYSLKDNGTARQAVSLYQAAYPEVFVEYVVGMEEGSSLTKEDALKKLNTEIAAGEGPDIFILDNMPVDSYIEKGLLLDLSPILESLDGEDALFENIVEAFRTGDGIYRMPCEIQLPIAFGKTTYVSGKTDLEGIADAMEALREDVPEKNLCGFCTKESVMKLFSMISVPDWKTEDGGLDKEGLQEYLVQIKRIYDAQMDGLAEEEIERYYDLSESYREIDGYSLDESADWIRVGVNYFDYVMGLRQIVYGTLVIEYEYAVLNAVQQMTGQEESEIALMKPDVFFPQTLAGINAASTHMEQAEDFFRFLFGKENQSFLLNGFAVNQAAFAGIWAKAEEIGDENCIDMGMRDEDGRVVTIVGGFPTEEELRQLQDWIESVSVPYIEDDLLEEAVYEEGAAYLEGMQSLENTVERIEKKVGLYMAE